MKTFSLQKFLSFLMVMAMMFLISCAKEKPYDETYKVAEETPKSLVHTAKSKGVDQIRQQQAEGLDFVGDDEFLYVPSTLGAPYQVKEIDQYFMGEEKIVKLRWSEDNLEVVEVPHDARFADVMELMPVLKIPVEHKDYRCSTNTEGECLNKEEEDTETHWSNRRYFEPDFAELSTVEMNQLELFSNDSCLTEKGAVLVNYTLTRDVINIEIEKTYKVSKKYRCIIRRYIDKELNTASFKVRYFYSLVKLKKLVSKNYKKIAYPIQDHDEYGFFKTLDSKLDDYYDGSRVVENYYINRWNPKRSSIVYYLSESFNKNLLLKKATYEAFESINASLKLANTGFKLELKEPVRGMITGDLRYNMINLIDKPLANGLLGYGPSVVNPRTGEIVHAHSNMYGGVLRSSIRWTYDRMVDLQLTGEEKTKEIDTWAVIAAVGTENEKRFVAPNDSSMLTQETTKEINKIAQAKIKELNIDRLRPIEGMSEEEQQQWNDEFAFEKRMQHYAKIGADPVEMISPYRLGKIEFPGVREIPGITNKDKTLKRWKYLTKFQKNKVLETILPLVYIHTLIHEVGHNLGLRHNFMGSYDKANFFKKEELPNPPRYSSLMDYGYSDLNELDRFGKYDVAALRFAYAREVETASGEFVRVPKTLNEFETRTNIKLKGYQYCTDENAGLSFRCNRFDEGSSRVEIANYHIGNYVEAYKYRNYRNDRNEFRTYGIWGSVAARNSMFRKARVVLELFELYVTFYGIERMSVGCSATETAQISGCAGINDVTHSVQMIGKLFLDILKTPDLLCAVGAGNDVTKVDETFKLVDFYEENMRYGAYPKEIPKSCFDQSVKKAVLKEKKKLVIGELGKYFNHIKDPNPLYKYSSDIGVRGVWHDKLLALKYLTKRYLGLAGTEDELLSMSDLPSIRTELNNFIEHISLGYDLKNPLKFKTENGNEFSYKYAIDNSYYIMEQPDMRTIRFLGLPKFNKIEWTKIALKMARNQNYSKDPDVEELVNEFHDYVTVQKNWSSRNLGDQTKFTYLDRLYYGAYKENKLAYHMVTSLNSVGNLMNLGNSKIENIKKLRSVNVDRPNTFSAKQVAASELSLEKLAWAKSSLKSKLSMDYAMLIHGDSDGFKVFMAYELGEEKLNEVIDFIKQTISAPTSATKDEKVAYDLDLRILDDYLGGNLDAKNNQYKKSLKLLPIVFGESM